MSTLAATTAKGKTQYDNQSWRLRDDISDFKVGGVYSHRNESWSATEADEWLSWMDYMTTVGKAGASSFPVRNVTGGTLTAGTLLYISGYNAANNRLTVDKADATNPAKLPTLVLDADISSNANGLAYPFAKVINLDTSAATAVGDKVFLHASTPGALAFTTAPTTVDAMEVGTVRVKDAVTGEVSFYPGLQLIQRLGPKRPQVSFINGQTAKATPVDADEVLINDIAGAALKKCTRRQFLNEPNQTDLTLLDASPRWYKYTKSYTDFTFAGSTNGSELFLLPAAGIIHAVKMKHTVSFLGGAISAYNISVGITGNATKYAPDFNAFVAVTNTAQQASGLTGTENHGSTHPIRAQATSTGGLLNAATQGTIEIWVLMSKAPS